MNEVDKINEQIAQLTAQRESVMLKEKANVLAKMKEDIKLTLRVCLLHVRNVELV